MSTILNLKQSRIRKKLEALGILRSGISQIDSEVEQTVEEQLFEQVFSIPLVLKKILNYLEIEDLVKTSLVNKTWNFFSREVVRGKRKCLAVVGGQNFCHKLKKLNDLLLNSESVPFNGLSLAVPWKYESNHECVIYADVMELMNNILRKINFKYLDLKFDDDDDNSDSPCIVFEQCIRKVMVEKASSLEELQIVKFPDLFTFSELIGLDLQGQWLPNVRFLEFPDEIENKAPMIQEIVEASPKLQKIYSPIETESLELILPLKVARAVKYFRFCPTIHSLRSCAVFSQENPQLEKLCFSTDDEDFDNEIPFSDCNEFQQNKVSKILKQLLESSQSSLRMFMCDHLDLILMTSQWNIPILKKVTRLGFGYSNDTDEAEGYSTLRKIDWAKYFPNLKKVYIVFASLKHLDRDFYITDAFRKSNEQFASESVEIFYWVSSNPGPIQMFKSIFPNVKECHPTTFPEWKLSSIMNELWNVWPDLELIHAEVSIKESIPNYDSVFLGISEEEAIYLLGNVEDLKSLEIVPTRPSIFNLPKLKKFKISIKHRPDLCEETSSTPDEVFLSRLAGQCGFTRISGLEVEILRVPCMSENCQFSLDHLKSFVTFVKE